MLPSVLVIMTTVANVMVMILANIPRAGTTMTTVVRIKRMNAANLPVYQRQ